MNVVFTVVVAIVDIVMTVIVVVYPLLLMCHGCFVVVHVLISFTVVRAGAYVRAEQRIQFET